MIINIVAMASNRVIGKDGKIPWNIPEDMKLFRKLTTGGCGINQNIVVMGRKTFESIGKPLPNRENWILSASLFESTQEELRSVTQDKHVKVLPGLGRNFVFENLDAIKEVAQNRHTNIFIIGGEQIYRAFLPICDRQIITHVQRREPAPEGDTFYPEFDVSEWSKIRAFILPSTDGYVCYVYEYIRNKRPESLLAAAELAFQDQPVDPAQSNI